MVPYAQKYLKCQQHRYLKTFGSQTENIGPFKEEEAIL